MARRSAKTIEVTDQDTDELLPDKENENNKNNKEEISKVSTMLAAVLNYLSNDEVEEIDIEQLFNNTEGLREWWDQYRENKRKQIEEEIKQSLGDLPLKELESIREKIKEKKK